MSLSFHRKVYFFFNIGYGPRGIHRADRNNSTLCFEQESFLLVFIVHARPCDGWIVPEVGNVVNVLLVCAGGPVP